MIGLQVNFIKLKVNEIVLCTVHRDSLFILFQILMYEVFNVMFTLSYTPENLLTYTSYTQVKANFKMYTNSAKNESHLFIYRIRVL